MASKSAKDTTVKVITVDFSGVKERGNFNPRRRTAGEYRARIVGVTADKSKAGNEQLIFTIQVDGDRRASYPYYCGLDTKSLWKIRNLIIAAGLRAPEGRAKFDPNKLVNKALGVFLDDDEYEGRVKSTIADVFPTSDGDFLNDGETSAKAKSRQVEDDDDEDEEDDDEPEPPKKSAKKAVAKKRAPEPEDDDEDEDDEEDEDEEPAPKKSAKKAPAKTSKKRVVEEDDEDEEDEDDEDDEPPAKKKPAKKAAKKSKKSRDDDDDDEMDIDDL